MYRPSHFGELPRYGNRRRCHQTTGLVSDVRVHAVLQAAASELASRSTISPISVTKLYQHAAVGFPLASCASARVKVPPQASSLIPAASPISFLLSSGVAQGRVRRVPVLPMYSAFLDPKVLNPISLSHHVYPPAPQDGQAQALMSFWPCHCILRCQKYEPL